MIKPGMINELTVARLVDFGVLLDGGSAGNILLPKRYAPKDVNVGDSLSVFLYYDSEDQLIATTEKPKLQLGQSGYLSVKDVNKTGAFLDWGLPKDLLVPFAEQQKPMQQGRNYVVTLLRDDQGRLVGSSKLNRHLSETAGAWDFQLNQEVDLLVWGQTDLGYKTVINQTHLGLLFRDDAFKPLKIGTRTKGYIKQLRKDGKISVSLQLPPVQQRDVLCHAIIDHLKKSGGVSTLTDKSAPDDIYRAFNVSKANYKKALGKLYKERQVALEEGQVRLLNRD